MFASILIVAAATCGAGVSRNINVWYPGETITLRMNDRNVCSNGQYDLTVTDWRERRVLTRAYDPKEGGRMTFPKSEIGSFGAFRVEIVERGTTNAPVAKTWFARLRSKNVEPVKWIGTHAHMNRPGYCDGKFIDMLAAAGVGLVRNDYCWHVCENPRGVYKPYLPYDFWFDALEKRGIGMVVLLSLWCAPDCYINPKDLSGFPGFCAYVADRFRGRNCVFEIYNEPQNTDLRRKVYAEEEKRTGPWTCWLVPMMETARKAAKAIHATDPDAKVYMFGEDVGDLLKRMIESGAATANEGISFHPYAKIPERQTYWFADGGAEIRALALKHGGATRFCGTEAGIPTIISQDFHHNEIAGNNFRATYENQAAVITRLYLMSRLTGMDFLCQYNWMNEGDDPKYTEHNFGQLFRDATPKPSFAATATLARILGKADVIGEKSPEPKKWRMGKFVRRERAIYACWSVEGDVKVDWPSALDGASFLDMMGNDIPAPKTEDGKLHLDGSPVYAVCPDSAAASGESFGEFERREYLKPKTSPLEGPAERVVFREGEVDAMSSAPSKLNGSWTLSLQDGRTLAAEVPGSIYTDLWRGGITDDPYFGTNDLLAATFSTQTNVYRCSFKVTPKAGSRYRLSFGGVTDTAEISLNGKRLGFHMGMFEAFEYELESSALREQNMLEVKLFPLRKQEDTLTCIITRGLHYCNLPSIGIWRDVTLDEIPAVEARRQFIVTRSAEKREIDYRVDVDSQRDCDSELRLSVRPSGFAGKSYCFEKKVRLSRGVNVFRYSFSLPETELWWPAGYGEQRVYEMTASVGGSSVTDDFGIRTFRFDPGPDGPKTNLYNRIAVVNGKRLFLKGAGWCICDALLRFDEPMYRRMFDRALEQGVNFFRAWGNGLVETEAFYRLCDREGILVLQEFPIPWYHSAEVIREPIFDMARRSVVRLRNHPSLIVWGGGNELCNNKSFSVHDEVINTVGRICCELDGTRDYWRTDPYAGSEHHHIAWTGWTPDKFLRHYADKEGICQNEYGLDTLMNVETLRRISGPEEHDMFPWRHFTAMAHHTATFNYDYIVNDFMRPKGKDVENHVWFGSHYLAQTNLESFVLSSQLAQVYATAYHAYNARTQFPKTGMYTYYKLNDVYPGSSWAVVDWFGSPKLVHYALKRAQRPLCAALRLAGHEFGAVAKIPLYLLDDAETLGKDSEWTIMARFLDKDLRTVSSRTFSGRGPVGQVRKLGEFANDPTHPLTSPSVLTWKLTVDGKSQGEDFVVLNVFDNPLKCAGFAQTSLSLMRERDGEYVIRNVGDAAAVGVMLDLGNASDRTVVEDNFFFLDAGASRRISVSPQSVIRAASALNARPADIRCL